MSYSLWGGKASLVIASFGYLGNRGSGSSWPLRETLLLNDSLWRAWETGRKHLGFPVAASPVFQMIQ